MSDADIESRCEFEVAYRAHYPELVRFVASRVLENGVQDVVADVFAVMWRRWGSVPPDRVRPWLYGIARGVLANEARARARRGRLQQRLEREPETTASDADFGWVHRALGQLSQRDQEALTLTEWDELDTAAAAAAAGCSEAAFRVRLHRARRRFAHALNTTTVTPPTADDELPTKQELL